MRRGLRRRSTSLPHVQIHRKRSSYSNAALVGLHLAPAAPRRAGAAPWPPARASAPQLRSAAVAPPARTASPWRCGRAARDHSCGPRAHLQQMWPSAKLPPSCLQARHGLNYIQVKRGILVIPFCFVAKCSRRLPAICGHMQHGYFHTLSGKCTEFGQPSRATSGQRARMHHIS